jgi:hypothetical protein
LRKARIKPDDLSAISDNLSVIVINKVSGATVEPGLSEVWIDLNGLIKIAYRSCEILLF